MPVGSKNPKVDFYFEKAVKWQPETRKLREIALDCGLEEQLKWGVPCYTSGKKNVILIHDFKDYCALLFMKGALLKDPHGLLIQQTENVQAARQMRFTGLKEILRNEKKIKACILEAIEVEKAGLKVKLKKTSEFPMPDELKEKLKSDAGLKRAFSALTPGRQRGYLLYFSSAKQSATRHARIEKCVRKIMDGQGLND
jgi:uncharacterized protein YdeI (YjbR/CyaY-like superfamily)